MNPFSTTRSRPSLIVVIVAVAFLAAACASVGNPTPPPYTSHPQSGAISPVPSAGQAPGQGVDATPVEEATATNTNAVSATPSQLAASPQPAGATTPAQATPAETASATLVPATAAVASATAASATDTPTATVRAAADLATLKLAVAPVAQGFSNPLDVVNARDGSGRLFVVERTGAIRIITDGSVLDKPFLDISDRVKSSGLEQGLLGLAFPPDYAGRKYFFVNYIDANGNTKIARYQVTADPDIADPASESIILTIHQPAPNHNGGNLVFGPDGYLWIGTGDGGGQSDQFGNGQNPDTLLAKMLRLDVTSDPTKPYVIPKDNPGVIGKYKVPPEAWAMGLRNPWRYSFDRATGDLWIGDVGQNLIEEVDVVRAGSKGGLNFGWSIMEGPECFRTANCDKTGLVLPVASYRHGADGCSITGGYVYRGKEFPALQGVYLYGDYCSGRIWGLNAANPEEPKLLLEVGAGLSSFGEDESGELYITNLGNGTVRRIVVP